MWQIQGKTFKQIVGYRYSYIRQNNEIKKILTQYKKGKISEEEYNSKIKKINIKSTMKCENIPDKDLKFISLFDTNTMSSNVNYDVVAFDTYDYIDKIIGFKLKDIFFTLFQKLYYIIKDDRARKMSLLIKYGTIDEKEIMLLRYGFDFETIDWLKDRIEKIDEDEIVFNDLDNFSEEEKKEIDYYL